MSNNVYSAMVKASLVFARVYDNNKRLDAVKRLLRGGMGRDGGTGQTGLRQAKGQGEGGKGVKTCERWNKQDIVQE